MTPPNLLLATQGLPIPSLTILQKIDDPLRLCTIYADHDGNLIVGLGGTRNSWLDWILNLDPSIEAHSLMDAIDHWIYVYQPENVTLAGHSQGGAHALLIAEWLPKETREVVTFGGLPTATDPGCKVTNYLMRSDPMAWVLWGFFGLRRFGKIIKLGKWGFSFLAHDPKIYIDHLDKL